MTHGRCALTPVPEDAEPCVALLSVNGFPASGVLQVAMKRPSTLGTQHVNGAELLQCSVSLWLRQCFAVPLPHENLGMMGSRVMAWQVQCCCEAASSSLTNSFNPWLCFCCLINMMLHHPGWPWLFPPSRAHPNCPRAAQPWANPFPGMGWDGMAWVGMAWHGMDPQCQMQGNIPV